jgi:cyclopropane fatty-acyl-phospholipid synthase-like methyltransferase
MTNNVITTTSTPARTEHDWEVAGDAWGAGANDWACLFEQYSHEVLAAIFQRAAIGADTHLLDIACGSGWALRHAEGIGVTAAGIDAARSASASGATANR